MVFVSRCLRTLTLLLAGAEGARIQRKRANDTEALSGEAGTDCYSMYDGQALLSLKPCDTASELLHQLYGLDCSLVGEEEQFLARQCNGIEIVCPHSAIAALEKGQIASLVAEDAGAHWRASSGVTEAFTEGLGLASDFYTTWRDLEARMARVETVVQGSGGLATLETVGKSLQGRDMKIVRLRGEGYESGGTRVVVTFNLHAREWIAGMAGIYTVEHLVNKVKEDPGYLAGTEVVLMPMGNPDGFVHSTTRDRMHRKNMADIGSDNRCWRGREPPVKRRGVDMNRNFDSHWAQGGSSASGCAETYHGPSPMSEPETKVIAKVMEEAPMTVYIDVHSFSAMIISSYGWTKRANPRATEYRAIGKAIQQAIKQVDGKTWTEGAVAQTLYPATGGTVDYADDRGALGICFELRPGQFGGTFAPPRKDILPGSQEAYAGILAAIDYAKHPPALEPGSCPWHGCLLGCGGENCQYCERCQ